MSDEVSDAELHAYLDGALPPARVAELRARIEARPELRRIVAAYAADGAALRAALHYVAAAPIPDRLLEAATRPPPARSAAVPHALWNRRSAVAGLAAAACAGLVYLSSAPAEPDPLVRAALAARRSAPRRILAFGEAEAALSAALGARVRVPDLSRAGYRLAQAALYDRAAELSYRAADGRVFTLYLAKSRGADRFALIERPHLRICIWENDELSTVMAADLPRAALFRLASLTYAALNA